MRKEKKHAMGGEDVLERATDWPLAPPSRSEFPDGIYVVSYKSCRKRNYYKQRKLELMFEIIEPAESAGLLVSLYCTLCDKLSTSCKFYQLWAKANGEPPTRHSRMSPKVFAGYWRVRVAWSSP